MVVIEGGGWVLLQQLEGPLASTTGNVGCWWRLWGLTAAAVAGLRVKLPQAEEPALPGGPQNPFNFLYRDSDVEGMTDGYDVPTAYGEIYGVDDPSMVGGGCLATL